MVVKNGKLFKKFDFLITTYHTFFNPNKIYSKYPRDFP